MQMLAPTSIYRHTKIRITSERSTQFIDLTDGLEALVAEAVAYRASSGRQTT